MADDPPLETLVRRVGRALDKDELDEPDDLPADERFGKAVERLRADAPEELLTKARPEQPPGGHVHRARGGRAGTASWPATSTSSAAERHRRGYGWYC